MATNPFDDLALRYVLADDAPTQAGVAKTAVGQIETAALASPASSRTAIGQWVASINRWLGSQDDDEDDIISRAEALGFLAATLQHLNRDILKADQVKLLIGFFCSLFSSDHRAGIEASTKALGYLAGMTAFQPTKGNDIINSITKLGSDDFKRQTPATRLEIYHLIRRLLLDPIVANDLAYQHGNTSGFMVSLLDLCKNERDPQNLVMWFEIMKLFLQNFDPADQVVDEVFKSYSAYFPITLRASATPSGITVDDLKRSLRSCFSAHHRVARLAIPFLLNKLDQGEAVTVSVKVDILQTLEACLAQYGDVKQGVIPYTDQIWSSLKYEVRNGEIRDSIEATLKTLSAAAKRLDDEDLQAFLAAVWIDLSDDLSSETYTESAGRLLAALSGSSRQSFALSTKQSIPHVMVTFRNTKSASHQSQLLGVLNAVLQVREALSTTQDPYELQDELFGDTLFDDIYARSWSSWTQNQFSNDRPAIIGKLIDGMAYMVNQTASDGSNRRLCSDATCNRVFSWLGTPAIIYPLEGRNFLLGSPEKEYNDIAKSASSALSKLAPRYPNGLRQLLERFLESVTVIAESKELSRSQAFAIRQATTRLCFIGSTAQRSDGWEIGNTLLLVTAFLRAFYRLAKVSPQYWHILIQAIHVALRRPLSSIANFISSNGWDDRIPGFLQGTERQDWVELLKSQIEGLPEIDKGDLGDLNKICDGSSTANDALLAYQQLLRVSFSIVTQLYRFSLRLQPIPGAEEDFIVDVSLETETASEGDTDTFLHRLGQLAADLIRFIEAEDQIGLQLFQEAFLLFTQPSDASSRKRLFRTVAVAGDEESDARWALCKHNYRTAPLVLGVLQGLRPAAMRELYSHRVLLNLCERLTTPGTTGLSTANRAALDAMLAILSNKLNSSSTNQPHIERLNLLRPLANAFTRVVTRAISQNGNSARRLEPDVSTSLQIFRSILHCLAGDIANYKPYPDENWLLSLVADTAPIEITIGRQLAQCFEILVSPKGYLTKEFHAVTRRLRGQWIYNQVARPHLDDCFPRQAAGQHGPVDDRTATNRSVAIFATLRHLDYAVWRSDASKVLLVVIRSLQTFRVSKDINTVLDILLKIMDSDSDLVREHLEALITHVLAVYQMARNVFDTLEFVSDSDVDKMSKKEAAMCRKSCLVFLQRLPKTFEAVRHKLLPQRQAVLRGLSRACGDPVREVREVAIVARRDWDALS
ncbi:putative Dos2-interacting transcription regulator of RNA-Pol-II-domain-containing protein [Seiridium unicorne]|uniref:MMS19 nucleotide excision repair protein n=1 Tax=Seiridium unicorne TaxID=138068 RepID=A0ABR2UU59_9PEZI